MYTNVDFFLAIEARKIDLTQCIVNNLCFNDSALSSLGDCEQS